MEHSFFPDLIKKEFDLSKHRYGATRIAEKLKREGYYISRCRVAKIMRANHWVSIHKWKFKATIDSNHSYPVCKNSLNRNFNPFRLNKVWINDITYIQTNQDWLYLIIIIDLFDRKVIVWSLSTSLHNNQTIIAAWKMAIRKRKINMDLLFHWDRAIQYAPKTFIKPTPLVIQSMSRKGNC